MSDPHATCNELEAVLRASRDDARVEVERLVAEVETLTAERDKARTERDRLLVKAEAMHLVLAPLSVKADVSDEQLRRTLAEAESGVEQMMRSPDGLRHVREAVGLDAKGGGV